MDINDSILVDNLRRGDLHSFDLLFGKYGKKLYGFAVRYLKSEADAEELVQDVYVKIWENRGKLKKESSFKSYLFTIAYNDICKVFRRRNYQKMYMNEIISREGYFEPVEEKADYSFDLEQIELLIDKLPPRRKEIFNMRHKKGKSSKEIANELNISPGTVDNNISEALDFIRKNLNKNNLEILLLISLFLS